MSRWRRGRSGSARSFRASIHFFASIPVARVIAVFRAAGYTRVVARLLASLCTTYSSLSSAPCSANVPPAADVHARWRSARRYAARHLPQGAPTSPALANLCAYGLDVRLSAAAAQINATYTRYADDLVFSSNARLDRFAPLVAAIAHDEGFVVNHRKTRLMRASVRQEVTGLVVNTRPAISRHELERLEAILFNCARHGAASQNRDAHPDFRAHLEGKLAWIASISAERAARLRALFDAVVWP